MLHIQIIIPNAEENQASQKLVTQRDAVVRTDSADKPIVDVKLVVVQWIPLDRRAEKVRTIASALEKANVVDAVFVVAE
jgi:hypothetical protein